MLPDYFASLSSLAEEFLPGAGRRKQWGKNSQTKERKEGKVFAGIHPLIITHKRNITKFALNI